MKLAPKFCIELLTNNPKQIYKKQNRIFLMDSQIGNKMQYFQAEKKNDSTKTYHQKAGLLIC